MPVMIGVGHQPTPQVRFKLPALQACAGQTLRRLSLSLAAALFDVTTADHSLWVIIHSLLNDVQE